jgi:hypothetical protein
MIIAGDGYVYTSYGYATPGHDDSHEMNYFTIVRIDTAGSKTEYPVWAQEGPIEDLFVPHPYMITNADNGIVFTVTINQQRWTGSITNGTVSLAPGPQIPGQYSDIVPVLQMEDGSFVGEATVDGQEGPSMVAFDQTGNVRWSVPNEQPQIATIDGGVQGVSGTTYDASGSATGQNAKFTQSWNGDAFQISPVIRVIYQPAPFATPPYWSYSGGSPSNSFTAPLCHDQRDQLIAEYGQFQVLDSSYPKPYPRFTPFCFQLTDSAASQYFTFPEINVPSPSLVSPEFNWALVKKPLVVPGANGYGLDYWRQLYGSARIINSGYRDPAQNAQAGGVAASRHQFGDAADLRNQSGTLQEWQVMFDLALDALADYRALRQNPTE